MSAPASVPRTHSDQIWGRARDAYLGGLPGPEVCERFGLGRTAFRERARREGWRRTDQPELDPDLDRLDDDEDDDAPAPTPGETAEFAWGKAARAARSGRVHESLAWMRLCRQAGELAERGFDADCRRAEADARRLRQAADAARALIEAETEALDQIEQRARPAAKADSPDSPDSDFAPSPPNRAARRRAQALARKANGQPAASLDSS